MNPIKSVGVGPGVCECGVSLSIICLSSALMGYGGGGALTKSAGSYDNGLLAGLSCEGTTEQGQEKNKAYLLGLARGEMLAKIEGRSQLAIRCDNIRTRLEKESRDSGRAIAPIQQNLGTGQTCLSFCYREWAGEIVEVCCEPDKEVVPW